VALPGRGEVQLASLCLILLDSAASTLIPEAKHVLGVGIAVLNSAPRPFQRVLSVSLAGVNISQPRLRLSVALFGDGTQLRQRFGIAVIGLCVQSQQLRGLLRREAARAEDRQGQARSQHQCQYH
jgi:hypothetical protein